MMEPTMIPRDLGDYIVLNGVKRNLIHHATDFSVDVRSPYVMESIPLPYLANVRQLAIGMSRVTAGKEETENLMSEVRKDKECVAHHIYQIEGTEEEIVITDLIFLTLLDESPDEVSAIAGEYKLKLEGQTGNVYTLQVTSESGRNPLKIANEIALRDDNGIALRDNVVSAVPEILFPIKFGSAPAPSQPVLFKDQWHLIAEPGNDLLNTSASMDVAEAWTIAEGKGSPEVVIAVIDDGFDLINPEEPLGVHKAFTKSIIDEEHMKNFGDEGRGPKNVYPTGNDFHGTSVASIIFADGDAMSGVAPGCTFLPIRIGSFSRIKPEKLIEILEEISPFANVVNCSFGMPAQSISLIDQPPDFIPRLNKLTTSGGKLGNGLVIVFSAGNDDAPIFLSKEKNQNGITVVRSDQFNKKAFKIEKDLPVHCGFAELPGVVVVGAMTSLKRKAGYSNWGEELTIVAPSDNTNDLVHLTETEDELRKDFPGLGIVAAINRSFLGFGGKGPARPIAIDDIPSTPNIQESVYTKEFGRTSAAAAMVSGVIGLMLSANKNKNLKPARVIDILKDTADRQMNKEKLFDKDDPNLKGVNPAFKKQRSRVFGSGKVNASAAVQRAAIA